MKDEGLAFKRSAVSYQQSAFWLLALRPTLMLPLLSLPSAFAHSLALQNVR